MLYFIWSLVAISDDMRMRYMQFVRSVTIVALQAYSGAVADRWHDCGGSQTHDQTLGVPCIFPYL